GDTYHTEKSQVQNDKRRDNLLESRGWNVLRYTTNDIEEHFSESINQVKETVNQYGGLLDVHDSSKFRYFPEESNEPTLFDEIGNKT
ncbi:MAG: DUF559 domain-containing protein, partial [Ignavibacteria bacterium]|nr:DUF559 domain-containing protein [Ignavibacteria bacterium]